MNTDKKAAGCLRHLSASVFICGVFLFFFGCRDSAHRATTSQQSQAAATPASQSSQSVFADPIARGIAYLVKDQQPEGYWGTGLETRGFEIYSMVPGSQNAFRIGTTALCIIALRQAGEKTAHDRAVEWLLNNGDARRDDGSLIYNTWAHIYATEALAIEMRFNPDPRVAKAAQWHIEQMARYASYTGGWNYYDFDAHTELLSLEGTSFESAAGLVALYEAKKSGLTIPQPMIDHAINRIAECKLPNGVYLYGADYRYHQRIPANRERGSIGRTQPDNFALLLWKSPKVNLDDARQGLQLFWDDHVFLEMGRKSPIPHQEWYQTSGYYYYFDHYYASLLIDLLPPSERPALARKLASFVVPHQEPDGSWWDYAMWDFHKPYGTAFAIMTLLNCDREIRG